MKHFLFALLLLAAFLSFPAASHAQRSRRTITGVVVDGDTGKPAENVTVELRNGEGLVVERTSTSSTGEFIFTNVVERSAYTLAINLTGYNPLSVGIDVNFNSGRGTTLTLTRPKEFKEPSAGGSTVSAHELSMPENARAAYEEGKRKLYEEKDTQTALKRFQAAVSAAPQFYEAHFQMGVAYLNLGNRSAAEMSERKAVDLSGDTYAEADFVLGSILLDQNHTDEGERVIRHGLQVDPVAWLGHYELGRALLNSNKVADAEKSAMQARALQPKAPMVYRLLANIHIREKNSAALLEDLNSYIRLDPDSPAGSRAKQMRDQVQKSMRAANPEKAPQL
jgi:Tfp pilus assembly protein PilF